jgi:DNA-binding PadR family transcriptional regulator
MAISDSSTIDLILLGLIKNQRMSAYDLSKMTGIFELVKISVPAIYKNVRRLKANGYLKSSAIKNGNMPEKKIYSITKQGEKRFQELLSVYSAGAINFYFDFNIPLLFVNSVDKKLGEEIIISLQSQLQTKQKYLAEQLEIYKNMPFPIINLGKQHLELNKMLLDWINEFRSDYKKIK